MPLPKQVQKQIADAKRIEGELRAEQVAAETPPTPEPVAPTPPVPPVEIPPVETPPVAAPAPAAPAPAPAPQPDAKYVELLQQYRTLQGIHRAQAHNNSELQSQVQTLQASVQSLTNSIEQLKQRPAAPASIAPITDDEIKEFGPDLISVIERKAQLVAAPLNEAIAKMNDANAKLAQRNAELEQSLTGVSAQQEKDAQARFESHLKHLVPDFDALNYDERFLSWLLQVDPLDARRRTLQQRLNEAVNASDAEAVAGFFNAFKSVAAQHVPAPIPKPDLSAQAQPVSRAAPDVTPSKTGRIWSPAEINAFYTDVSRGVYTPTDKARIEKEIFAAQKDNRIAA